ncbi:hypothetical protein RIF29_35264 [Crotalaria pallida]|uniref:C2H2-type domain-containing protein n=1 Tax=Crotalaria pallida TaxID=3830 RepID=A0AAN9HV29_CROPI
MERHKCKLCSRSFSNGRALGGHMKAHLATLPLPPKPQTFHDPFESASFSYQSQSSKSSSEEEERDEEQVYGLRENPKKSLRYADPEFSFNNNNNGFVVVVQDRESETESKKPTRQRSKRNRKSSMNKSLEQSINKKFKFSFMESPPLSSVSDFSPEEDVAMCLMMLSRDKWRSNNNVVEGEGDQVKKEQEEEEEGEGEEIKLMMKKKRVRGKNECENCGKKFRSSRALGSHRSICCSDEAEGGSGKIFECPFCFKVFGSGQALGGHKRSHLMMQQSSSSSIANNNNNKESFIDLNLPAPIEEDDLSVVSHVSNA